MTLAESGAFGNEPLQTGTLAEIGKASKQLADLADELKTARESGIADRVESLTKESVAQAATLTTLKTKHDDEIAAAEAKAKDDEIASLLAWSKTAREPSMAKAIGNYAPQSPQTPVDTKGAFLFGVHEANAHDTERQAAGKAILAALRGETYAATAMDPVGKAVLDVLQGVRRPDAKAYAFEEAWGKATLGTTDATGGWVIPNAIVDDFIVPAQVRNIYRDLMTVRSGVTAFAVDQPFRSGVRAPAVIAAFGATKENVDLAYNGYTATMYTLARIYDISNQFLRQSRGAAEADVLSELAAAFAQGEANYIREGSGSSQPYGYTAALTNGPATFRSTFSPSASTLAGSILTAIATAAGALAGRGVTPTAGVLAATTYWTMASQGLDGTGFFYAPAGGPSQIRPNTLLTPWGLPIFPDAAADLQGTSAVIDNLVVADWKAFKVYFGESYRVDSSDQAGTRWDTNLTGFRGEEEMGFDARPVVYAGYAQMITDVLP